MCALSAPASGSKNMFSFTAIYRNYLKCRRNKRNSINALKFEIDAERNIVRLERKLRDKTFRPSRCILFTAHKPKTREIFASSFSDRIVHHILIGELQKIWDPIFIHDSYACRDGKGTHKGVIRLQKFLRQASKNGNVPTYYLQLDIKDFFISINKKILFDLITKKVANPDLLWIVKETIFWDCTKDYVHCGNKKAHSLIPENKSLFGKKNERGLPIGNLTSQYFANIYLNELDQFVKHELKAKYYLRYVDDFVIVENDQEKLKKYKSKIGDFLQYRLKLSLHPRRHKIQKISSGIDFLGYIVRQNYILVRNRVVNNFKSKINSEKDPIKLRDSSASYLGHFKWANSFTLTNKLMERAGRSIHARTT